MKAYIDDLKIIRVETDVHIFDIHLKNDKLTWFKNENGSQFFFCEKNIRLNIEDKIYINQQIVDLEIGLVTLTSDFEKLYRYDGVLGAVYFTNETIFRVFTPVAKEVRLILSDDIYEMNYHESGIYEITVEGNHDGKNYFFDVRLQNTFKRVSDPYAKASNLLGPVVIDFKKTSELENFQNNLTTYTDAIIYEGHVRDLTINLDVEYKGLYQGLKDFSQHLGKTVIEYITDLGVTHLQLMPVYDFEGVDDVKKNQAYNWGYNPSQYFTLEGWYSKEPNNAYERIEAFKSIIEHAHQNGLSINLDVVYNHVYQTTTFPYDDLVPGYFYRHDYQHIRTNHSYCGNDIETRNYMVRKLIVDSLIHFTKEYKIDGYRFDLMGLMDINTMIHIEKELKKINPKIMLYGEGWVMDNSVLALERSNMKNQHTLPNYAHFNDDFRDTIRGSLHGNELGYALGNNNKIIHMKQLIAGSKHIFDKPSQSINYVECHDNYTFFDRMSKSIKPDQLKQDLATHLVIIARGIPFLHAGQEFYRTKKGVENSYKSSDIVNQVTWSINQQSINKIKSIIEIRKKYPIYRLNDHLAEENIMIEQNVIIISLKDKNINHRLYIKNDYTPCNFSLENYEIIFGNELLEEKEDMIILCKPGVYIAEIRG